jgi:hypothetical protein
MTSLRQAIRAKLEANTALAALATGGIWDHDEIAAAGYGRDGLTVKVIATSGSNPVIKPSIYVKTGVGTPIYPIKAQGKNYAFDIFFYDQQDFEVIQQMRDLVYEALHEQRVTFTQPANWYCRQIVFAADVLNDWRDETLKGAATAMSRYRAYIIKLAEGY